MSASWQNAIVQRDKVSPENGLTNINLFGVFSTQALASLYESFPVPMRLPREKMTALMSVQKDMWAARRELSTVEGMESLLKDFGVLTPELAAKAHAKRTALEVKTATHEAHLKTVIAVYDGTLFFLEVEGYIRKESPGVYQLTSKGLAQLNKRFDQGDISITATLFHKLRDALQPDQFLGSVTSGALVSLAGKIFGA